MDEIFLFIYAMKQSRNTAQILLRATAKPFQLYFLVRPKE